MRNEALVFPHDPNWNQVRRAWNLASTSSRKQLRCQRARQKLRRSSGGRALEGSGSRRKARATTPPRSARSGHTLLLKTERMRGVEIDPGARIARVDAGVLWAEVGDAAAQHGLAALAGSSPDVGVVGYTLGGGISWLARKHGLATNSVVAVELVNADGEIVRADADQEEELFWALRGGGGSFGVVTALEFSLFPISTGERRRALLPARARRRDLARVAPVDRGRARRGHVGRALPAVSTDPGHPRAAARQDRSSSSRRRHSSTRRAGELLAPLRELGPAIDTFATIPVEELRFLHMDPEKPMRASATECSSRTSRRRDRRTGRLGGCRLRARRSLGRDSPAGRCARALAAWQRRARCHPCRFRDVRGRNDADARGRSGHEAHVEAVQAALAPWDVGSRLPQLHGAARARRAPVRCGHVPATAGVKAKVDPEDVFRSNHPVRLPASRLREAA